MKICMYGSGSKNIEKKYLDAGYELGKKIAETGNGLVFGGGNHGLMGSVARGAKDHDGHVIGVFPEWMDVFEELYPYCDELIYTKSMDERKNIFVEKSDVFIICPGGIGTLDEFFEIVALRKLKRHKKTIIVYNYDAFYDKMIDMLDYMKTEDFLYKDNSFSCTCSTIGYHLILLQKLG